MQNDLPNYLFHQGTNYNAYDYLGAHYAVINDKSGVVFRVWAPNADKVYVTGDFRSWNNFEYLMNKINDSGVWELFIEGIEEFYVY